MKISTRVELYQLAFPRLALTIFTASSSMPCPGTFAIPPINKHTLKSDLQNSSPEIGNGRNMDFIKVDAVPKINFRLLTLRSLKTRGLC